MLSRQRSTPVHAPCIKVVGGATKLEAALGAKSAGIFDPVSMLPLPCCAAVDAPSLCRPCGWARCVRVWVCGCASPVHGDDAPTRIAGQAACGSG